MEHIFDRNFKLLGISLNPVVNDEIRRRRSMVFTAKEALGNMRVQILSGDINGLTCPSMPLVTLQSVSLGVNDNSLIYFIITLDDIPETFWDNKNFMSLSAETLEEEIAKNA